MKLLILLTALTLSGCSLTLGDEALIESRYCEEWHWSGYFGGSGEYWCRSEGKSYNDKCEYFGHFTNVCNEQTIVCDGFFVTHCKEDIFIPKTSDNL